MILTKLRKEGCHELEYKLGCQVRAYLKKTKEGKRGKGDKEKKEGGKEGRGERECRRKNEGREKK